MIEIIDTKDMANGNGNSKQLKQNEVSNSEVEAINLSSSPTSSTSDSDKELFAIDMELLLGQSKQGSPVDPQGRFSLPPSQTSMTAGSSTASHNSETLLMAPPRGYDPNRIPASVFGARPVNPMDWSVASNESLFSLHIGNGSFSRENFMMLYKSGELTKLEEPVKPVKPDEASAVSKPEEPVQYHPSLPPVTEAEQVDKMCEEDMQKCPNMKDISADDAPKAAVFEPTEDNSEEKAVPAEYVHVCCNSDGSLNSTKSFAFPVLDDDETQNKSIKMKIAKKDLDRLPATSEVQERPQEWSLNEQQLQAHKTKPKASAGSWFSCFSCFSARQFGGK